MQPKSSWWESWASSNNQASFFFHPYLWPWYDKRAFIVRPTNLVGMYCLVFYTVFSITSIVVSLNSTAIGPNIWGLRITHLSNYRHLCCNWHLPWFAPLSNLGFSLEMHKLDNQGSRFMVSTYTHPLGRRSTTNCSKVWILLF